jgi:hypothetical protein
VSRAVQNPVCFPEKLLRSTCRILCKKEGKKKKVYTLVELKDKKSLSEKNYFLKSQFQGKRTQW